MEYFLGLGLFVALFAVCCVVGYLGRAAQVESPTRNYNEPRI